MQSKANLPICKRFVKPHVAAGHDGYCTTLASYCPRRTLSDGCRSAQPDDFTRKPFTMVQHRHGIVRKFCHRRRHVRWYRQKRILRIQWDKRSDRSSHSLSAESPLIILPEVNHETIRKDGYRAADPYLNTTARYFTLSNAKRPVGKISQI